MKLKKLEKVLDKSILVRVWGKSEDIPLYSGYLCEKPFPDRIRNYKIANCNCAYDIEFRTDCTYIEDHIAIQVIEE